VRCDRTGGKRGGVALYVSSTLKIKVLATSEGVYCGKPEFIIAEIIAELDKLLLAIVYRPQRPAYSRSLRIPCLISSPATRISLSLVTSMLTCARRLTTGRHLRVRHLREFLDTSNLLVPYNPTYHLENSSTWLDICAVDDVDKFICSGQRDSPSCQPMISSILSTTSVSPEAPPDQPGRAISEVSTMMDFCVTSLSVTRA